MKRNRQKAKIRACGALARLIICSAIVIDCQGCGASTNATQHGQAIEENTVDRLPKSYPAETITSFDALNDASGNLFVVWKNSKDALSYATNSISGSNWLLPRSLGTGGRSIRLVAVKGQTWLIFSSGPEIYCISNLFTATDANNFNRQKVITSNWNIPSFSLCSDGQSVFVVSVAPASEKRAAIYQLEGESSRLVKSEMIELLGSTSMRDPEIAVCFENGRIHLILREDDAILAHTSIDPQTLKQSAWRRLSLAFTSGVSTQVRQIGVGLILDGTLNVRPIAGNLVVSFTANSPMLLLRDNAGQWSGVSMLAAAGAGRADGCSVSVAPSSNGWSVAWIDARHQEKSQSFGIPWSDDNPYWGNNDVYSVQIPAPGRAEEFNASLAQVHQLRVTHPLGFARCLMLLPNVKSGQAELFWLGTDRVAKATKGGVNPFHGIFHTTLQP